MSKHHAVFATGDPIVAAMQIILAHLQEVYGAPIIHRQVIRYVEVLIQIGVGIKYFDELRDKVLS